eukprot:COSAG01_NODE_64440_length_276_cov_0.920904_1_plen_45_part_01
MRIRDGQASKISALLLSKYSRRPEVLGYNLINEPFAGDFYRDPLI